MTCSNRTRRFLRLLWIPALLLWLSSSCDELLNPNNPPVIEAVFTTNDIYTVNPGDTVTVVVRASDPQDSQLFYRWEASGGELLLPTDRDSVRWAAPPVGGTYQISVTVSNVHDKSSEGALSIEVISQENPTVTILSPANGDFVVQHRLITISASAFHVNGLQSVALFVDDTLRAQQAGHANSNRYDFDFRTDLPAGLHRIRVTAAANNSGRTGEDQVDITVEGIITRPENRLPD